MASSRRVSAESLNHILGRIFSRTKLNPRARFLFETVPTSPFSGKPRDLPASASPCPRLPVLVNNVVDHPVFFGLLGIHDVIPFDVLFDALYRLPRVLRQNLVDRGPHPQNLFRVQVVVRRPPAAPPQSKPPAPRTSSPRPMSRTASCRKSRIPR